MNPSDEEAKRAYAREYRRKKKEGLIVPKPIKEDVSEEFLNSFKEAIKEFIKEKEKEKEKEATIPTLTTREKRLKALEKARSMNPWMKKRSPKRHQNTISNDVRIDASPNTSKNSKNI